MVDEEVDVAGKHGDDDEDEEAGLAPGVAFEPLFELLIDQMVAADVEGLLHDFGDLGTTLLQLADQLQFFHILFVHRIGNDFSEAVFNLLLSEDRSLESQHGFRITLEARFAGTELNAGLSLANNDRVGSLITEVREGHNGLSCANKLNKTTPSAVSETTEHGIVIDHFDLREPGTDPEVGILIWVLLKKLPPSVFERPNHFVS